MKRIVAYAVYYYYWAKWFCNRYFWYIFLYFWIFWMGYCLGVWKTNEIIKGMT